MQTSEKTEEFIQSLAEWVKHMPEIKKERPSRRSQSLEHYKKDKALYMAKFRRSCTLNKMYWTATSPGTR